MTAVDQTIYGLRVRSDRPLPGLPHAIGEAPADVAVSFSAAPPGVEGPWEVGYASRKLERDRPVVTFERLAESGMTRLVYGEGIRFTFDATATCIWVSWESPLTFADAVIFLTGPVLGHVLRRRGVLALHASAVVIGGTAVAFVGAGGAGKSTMAAALAARGHPFVTDDVLALRPGIGGWLASPGYENVRIWETSERLLFGDDRRLAPVSETWEKRVLSLGGGAYRLQRDPVALGALLVLDPADETASAAAVHPARGRETLLALIAGTSVGYLLDDAARVAELASLAELLRGVKVGHLVPAAGGSSPAELADRVEGWRREEP